MNLYESLFGSVEEQVQHNLKEGVVLPKQHQEKLDNAIEAIQNFIKENKEVNKLDIKERDLYHKQLDAHLEEYRQAHEELSFNLVVTGKSFLWFKELFTKTLRYKESELWLAYKIDEIFLSRVEKSYDIKSNKELYHIDISILEINVIQTLLREYQVIGLGRDAKHFNEISKAIANIMNIYQLYTVKDKKLGDDILAWKTGAEKKTEEPVIETKIEAEVVEAEVVEGSKQ